MHMYFSADKSLRYKGHQFHANKKALFCMIFCCLAVVTCCGLIGSCIMCQTREFSLSPSLVIDTKFDLWPVCWI